jgi:hypothetical protein
MSSIRPIELKLVDQLFERPADPGYVLDFSNNTFASFFAQELDEDIYQERFSARGTSKMNRLRCYLELATDEKAAKALHGLWEYRETLQNSFKTEVPNAERRLTELVIRLGGKPISTPQTAEASHATRQAVDPTRLDQLRNDLIALTSLPPQRRGLAFERFLKELFNAYGMEGHGSISIRGEQIDGSFRLDGQTYLLEAKWQNEKTGAADLHTFEGKLGQKAVWTRGLFISQSGFTDEGIHAFGRGKRVICMDGLDLWEALSGTIPLPEIVDRKATRASQTGEIFVRVRDLIR